MKITLIRALDKIITALIFLSYPLLIVYYYFYQRDLLVRSVLVPAVSFAAVTVFRYTLNAKRPYEVTGEKPIIEKETKGKSFPSRHVFSAFMVAMTYMQTDIVTAVALMALGVALSVIRVFGKVHYVRDVVAGAIIGTLLGWIGLFLIPWS